MPLHSPHHVHAFPRTTLAWLAACALVGCTPTLDWREVRPAGTHLQLLFPCKPSAQQRQVPLAGQRLPMTLHACAAGGQTWSLAMVDVADPARVTPALAGFSAVAATNIGAAPPGAATAAVPFAVRGATPNPGSQRLLLQGKLPDGTRVTLHAALFSHGTQVFQASVLGGQVSAEAADMFFDALRVQP